MARAWAFESGSAALCNFIRLRKVDRFVSDRSNYSSSQCTYDRDFWINFTRMYLDVEFRGVWFYYFDFRFHKPEISVTLRIIFWSTTYYQLYKPSQKLKICKIMLRVHWVFQKKKSSDSALPHAHYIRQQHCQFELMQKISFHPFQILIKTIIFLISFYFCSEALTAQSDVSIPNKFHMTNKNALCHWNESEVFIH